MIYHFEYLSCNYLNFVDIKNLEKLEKINKDFPEHEWLEMKRAVMAAFTFWNLRQFWKH